MHFALREPHSVRTADDVESAFDCNRIAAECREFRREVAAYCSAHVSVFGDGDGAVRRSPSFKAPCDAIRVFGLHNYPTVEAVRAVEGSSCGWVERQAGNVHVIAVRRITHQEESTVFAQMPRLPNVEIHSCAIEDHVDGAAPLDAVAIPIAGRVSAGTRAASRVSITGDAAVAVAVAVAARFVTTTVAGGEQRERSEGQRELQEGIATHAAECGSPAWLSQWGFCRAAESNEQPNKATISSSKIIGMKL